MRERSTILYISRISKNYQEKKCVFQNLTDRRRCGKREEGKEEGLTWSKACSEGLTFDFYILKLLNCRPMS